MASYQPPVAEALRSALYEGLELHLKGITDPQARSAATLTACGRIAKHLAAADLPVAAGELATHRAMITAALQAAARQLCVDMADA